MRILSFFCMLAVFSLPVMAHAYIGPGLGAGTIGIILGFVASIFLALFAIFWYPIKALLKKMRGSKSDAAPVEEAQSSTESKKSDEV